MKKIISITLICVAASVLTAGCMKNADYYYLSAVSLNSEMGSIQGAGSYSAGTTATLQATPADGCYFVGWVEGEGVSDQDNIEDIITSWDNPYEVSVNSNVSYTAIFRRWGSAECSVQFGNYGWNAAGTGVWYHENTKILEISVYSKKEGYERGVDYAPEYFPSVNFYWKGMANGVSLLGKDELFKGAMPRLFYYKDVALDLSDPGLAYAKHNRPYGDWWADTAKVVMYGFDREQGKVSMVIEAEMYDAVAVLENGVSVENAEKRKMIIRMMNISVGSR